MNTEYSEGRTIEALALAWRNGVIAADEEFVPVEQYRELMRSRDDYRKRAYARRGEPMSDKIKVVLYVDGGVVQTVFASLPDTAIEVDIVDADDLEAEGKSNAEISDILSEATEFLYPIW